MNDDRLYLRFSLFPLSLPLCVCSYIKICHTLEDLEFLARPLVVLCTFPSLEFGYSRDLFVQWCSNPNNLILFTDRGIFISFHNISKYATHNTYASISFHMKREREKEYWIKRKHFRVSEHFSPTTNSTTTPSSIKTTSHTWSMLYSFWLIIFTSIDTNTNINTLFNPIFVILQCYLLCSIGNVYLSKVKNW